MWNTNPGGRLATWILIIELGVGKGNPMTTNGKPETSESRQWKGRLGSLLGDKLFRGRSMPSRGQIEQKRAGKLTDEVFAEMRLRRGVYGQRLRQRPAPRWGELEGVGFPERGPHKGSGDAVGMRQAWFALRIRLVLLPPIRWTCWWKSPRSMRTASYT